jgi:hypothetical protein
MAGWPGLPPNPASIRAASRPVKVTPGGLSASFGRSRRPLPPTASVGDGNQEPLAYAEKQIMDVKAH